MAQDPPPNILLIITDQHAGSIMNQRGYPDLQTPGIDKLAEEGVTFTRGYCAFPVCQSSRKSIFTGIMPGLIESETSYPSISKTLNTAGYETAYFGKWHVGGTDIDLDKEWHGFEIYQDGHDDTEIRGQSVGFLKKNHERPFFLMTSFQNPHDACELARIIAGMEDSYHDGPVEEHMDTAFCPPLPCNFAIPANEAEGFSGRRNQEPGDKYWDAHPTTYWTNTQWRQYLYGYDRLVEKVDAHIEALYDELDSLDLLENTVIIYTADHGDGHASHHWNQKKTFYEEAINIPFIISWKGQTRAGIIEKEVLVNSGLDLYPTILKLAGLSIPESLHGIDLSPALLQDPGGAELESREYIVSEIDQTVVTGFTPGTFNGRMLVTGNFKYILFDRGVNREQLFDLENDPGELNPVTDDPDYRMQLDTCRQMLKEWVTKISDNFKVDQIISSYESESNANSITINGTSLDGFDPETLNYTLRLEYSDSVIVGTVPINSGSEVSIIQAANPWGDLSERTARIHIVSEDGTANTTYKIILDVKEYVNPESAATLTEISINGTPIPDFDSEIFNYTVVILPPESMLIEAVPFGPEASVELENPENILGDILDRTALIKVISKDGSQSNTYLVTIEITNLIFRTGFIDLGLDEPAEGWAVNYGMISENIGGPGNHGEYEGAGAYKFVRGQVDKVGSLTSSLYEKVQSISFWMYIQNPDNSAKLKIESKTGSESRKSVGLITASELSATSWTYFSFIINREEATQIIFTPTLPYDGDTRLWMDDLAIQTAMPESGASLVGERLTEEIFVYPNPASEYIHVRAPGISKISIYNLAGQLQLSRTVGLEAIPIGQLNRGMYLIRFETDSGTSTLKFIKQ